MVRSRPPKLGDLVAFSRTLVEGVCFGWVVGSFELG